MPSNLEIALRTIIVIFNQYATIEGDKDKLSKKELKELLQNELGDFLKTPRHPDVMNNLFHDADQNSDGAVNFKEFMMLLSTVLLKET